MRKLRTALLAGAGILLGASVAVAARNHSHVMTVALPDGEIAQIHYTGNVAPRVMVNQPASDLIAFADPFVAYEPDIAYGPSPFAELERVSALMDQEAHAMMMRVASAQREMLGQAPARHMVSTGAQAPSGVVQYSYVSTTSNNGCTTSISWSSDGSGAKPRMIKTSSGDCAATGPSARQPQKTAAPKADTTVPGAQRT